MKTLVTAIQKGGQGKTFATCHLAFDFLERGLRVAVIDLDTQGNASFTLSAYQSGYLASQLFTGDTDDLRVICVQPAPRGHCRPGILRQAPLAERSEQAAGINAGRHRGI